MPILGDLYNELLKQPEPEAARIAAALLAGLLLAIIAYGCASALDYDDYSADYWDPTGHYRQIDEERRMEREAQERDWATRYDNNN